MSDFENYHKTSQHYDLTRVPVGLEIIAKALGRSPTQLGNQTLLDAGCGTGAYAAAFVSRVKGIVAIDLNPVDPARRSHGDDFANGDLIGATKRV